MSLKLKAFWLKNSLFRSGAMETYRKAMADQERSASEIEQINWRKRKSIVEYAYQNSAFYHEYYEQNGFVPRDLRSPADWAKVPIVEKRHLREFGCKLLVKHLPKSRLIRTTTGGSTGTPVLTYRDRRFPEEVIKWRMLERWGSTPAEDILMLWRIPPSHDKAINVLVNSLMWWPTRRYKFDVSSLCVEHLKSIERVLIYNRPSILWGYVGALEEVALYLREQGSTLDYSPLVWATASPTSRAQFELFRTVFGPRILDQYACSEVHWIASNVFGYSDLLVDSDFRHVDVVSAATDLPVEGKFGDLLITDLENRVFPLIRYRNGDRASMRPTDQMCGYCFPRISPVKGRTADTLRSPSGRRIPGEYITTIFDGEHNGIRQFSVHQLADYSVTVMISLTGVGKECTEKVEKLLNSTTDDLERKLGNEVPVVVEIVDRIPHDRGKTRFVQSDVPL